MRMIDEITLINRTEASRPGGVPVMSETETEVYADAKSAKRAEWYSAHNVGIKADLVFEVNADEYDGQDRVRHCGTTYRVIRSFRVGLGRVELVCEVIR